VAKGDPAVERLQRFCQLLRALRQNAGDPTLAKLSRIMPSHPGTSTIS